MRYTNAIILFATATSVTAQTLKKCAADNCLRAIRATAFPTRPGTADCYSYFRTTVTPTTETVTETTTVATDGLTTVTNTIYETTPIAGGENTITLKKRQAASPIPAYASPCSGSVRYSSACSCIGATTETITAETPFTTTFVTETVDSGSTATVTAPTTVTETVTSFLIQLQNGFEGAYLKPVDSVAQFTLEASESAIFYLYPDGTLLSNAGVPGSFRFGNVPSWFGFGSVQDGFVCQLDADAVLTCTSGEYDTWGTYANNYAFLIGKPDTPWANYAGQGPITLKAVPPPV